MTDYLVAIHRVVHTATVEQFWMYDERLSYAWEALTDLGKPAISSDDVLHQVSFAATVAAADSVAAFARVHRVSTAVIRQLGDQREITVMDGFTAEVRPVIAADSDSSGRA